MSQPLALGLEYRRERRILGQGALRIKPAVRQRSIANPRHRLAPYPLRARDIAVRLPQPQPGNALTNLVHLEPPVGHPRASREKLDRLTLQGSPKVDNDLLFSCRRLYRDNALAPLCRQSIGATTPKIYEPLYADDEMAT